MQEILPMAERSYEVFCNGDPELVRLSNRERGAPHRVVADVRRSQAKATISKLSHRCPQHGSQLHLYRYTPAESDSDETTWGQ